jgi:leucyl aminopeptidase
MEFFTTTSAASRRAGGCVVVGVYEKGKPGLGAAEIDTASKGLIKRHIKDGDISGRIGTSLLLPAVPGVRSARVLVVGLGKSAEFGVTQFRRANETAIRLIKGSKVRDIVNYLTLEDVDGASPYYLARYAVETTGNCFYTFNEMKSGRKRRTPLIRKMGIAVKKRGDAAKTRSHVILATCQPMCAHLLTWRELQRRSLASSAALRRKSWVRQRSNGWECILSSRSPVARPNRQN